jgi:predicted metal-dependent peptidase
MRTLIAIDYSGSISVEDAVLSLSIAKIIKMLIPKSVFILFDSEIRCITKTIDFSNLPKTMGATNVTCVYDYFKKHKTIYSNLILITDGAFALPEVSKSLLKKTQVILYSGLHNEGLNESPFFAHVKQYITL